MTNTERAQALLTDGRWHCITDIAEVAGRESARTRMSELNRAYPGRYERRFRTHTSPDGRRYSMTDWRDTSDDDRVRGIIHRALASVPREGRPGTAYPVRVDGVTVCRVTVGQMRLFTLAEMERRVFEAWSGA